MYDIPELEKKWRKYKRNQIKKPLLIALSALILVGGVGVITATYLNKSKQEEAKEVKNTPPQKQVEEKKAIIITKTQADEQKSSGTSTSQNSTTQNPLIVAGQNHQQPSKQEESIDLSNAKIIKPNLPKEEIRVIGFDEKEKKKVASNFNSVVIPQKSVQDIQEKEKIAEIEERFKATQDPQDSLYIAKYYYKKGNYKKAETWAINTNNIDGDIEDSWIIFAKARAKQGFRVDAIKVLQSYYDETKSPKAKALLDKLRFGKSFK